MIFDNLVYVWSSLPPTVKAVVFIFVFILGIWFKQWIELEYSEWCRRRRIKESKILTVTLLLMTLLAAGYYLYSVAESYEYPTKPIKSFLKDRSVL